MMRDVFDDDEPIVDELQEGEAADVDLDEGKTEARIINKQKAPLEESPFKVLVELKGVAGVLTKEKPNAEGTESDGGGKKVSRLGVDLVTILDISRSMSGRKLNKMKLAMQFLIQKLSGVDRLSVVSYNRRATKLCPLRQITEDSQTQIINLINDLKANSTTDTEGGLRMGLNILNGRTVKTNRSVAIMLMTDGMENPNSHASRVPVSEVPVYTFAFGRECDEDINKVLKDIAVKSKGGKFTAVPDLNDLTVAFSVSLAGILNVSIEDLSLTVTPLNSSQLNKVNAGNYPQTEQATAMDPITVTYTSIYDRETRKVLANLTLPKVDRRLGVQIFKVAFRYRVLGKDAFDEDQRLINVTRTEEPNEEEIPELLAEETRIETANSMKNARILADQEKLKEARKMLEDANTSLPEIEAVLRAQVEHLHLLMASQETYDKQGRAFALAVEDSHETQRATALPDGIPSLYETPITAEFKKQAKNFDLDPQNYDVPTAEEDRKATAPPPPPPSAQQVDRANKIQEIRDLIILLTKKVDELEGI